MNDNDNSTQSDKLSLCPPTYFGTPTETMSEVEAMLLGITAKEIAPGVTLMTKDGRTTGNAIVIGQTTPSSESMVEYIEATDQRLWLVETDFGNQMKLTDREINDWYHLGFQRDYDAWWNARIERITESIESTLPGTKLRSFIERMKEKKNETSDT